MNDLVFLLEERSAQVLLEGLLPRLGFELAAVRFIPFEGKADLDRQVDRKLKAWLKPRTRFVILRDQDSADCTVVKNSLLEKCRAAGRSDTVVRIACRALESWYLGDLQAVEAGLGIPNLARLQNTEKYRQPDSLGSPDRILMELTNKRYQKIGGSRLIAPHLSLESNRSQSFRVFLKTLRTLRPSAALGYPGEAG